MTDPILAEIQQGRGPLVTARTEGDLPPDPHNGAFAYVVGSGWFYARDGRWRKYTGTPRRDS